jgi:hypothetical protein
MGVTGGLVIVAIIADTLILVLIARRWKKRQVDKNHTKNRNPHPEA